MLTKACEDAILATGVTQQFNGDGGPTVKLIVNDIADLNKNTVLADLVGASDGGLADKPVGGMMGYATDGEGSPIFYPPSNPLWITTSTLPEVITGWALINSDEELQAWAPLPMPVTTGAVGIVIEADLTILLSRHISQPE